MILAIDTGNTHIVIGLMNNKGEVINNFRIPTNKLETDCGYAVRLGSLFQLINVNPKEIDSSLISSVVPAVTRELSKAIKMLTGKEAIILGQIDSGLDISAIPGGMIAPDLEAAAIAAREQYALPSIIIDMGTATTVTIVNEKGAYIGGAILPGVGTALNALVDKTSLLPGIDIVAPAKAIAVDTVPSMQSGLVYGAAGAIDGILDHFIEEMEVKPESIVVTGGLGKIIGKYCRHDMVFDDDLILKGLYEIWKGKNK